MGSCFLHLSVFPPGQSFLLLWPGHTFSCATHKRKVFWHLATDLVGGGELIFSSVTSVSYNMTSISFCSSTYYHFLLLSGGHICFVSLLIRSVLLGLVTSVSWNMTSLCLLYTLFYLYQLLTCVLYNTMCTDQLFSNGIVPSICICNMYCATISFGWYICTEYIYWYMYMYM